MIAKDWSPRFGDTFFTFSLVSRIRIMSKEYLPFEKESFEGNHHFPAIYYKIVIKYGSHEITVLRRYSQFYNLYKELRKRSDFGSKASETYFPPKTCLFQHIDDDFLDDREEELENFLDGVLKRTAYANIPAVRKFLGLKERKDF